MSNNLRDLSNRTGDAEEASDATAVLDPVLQDGETVRFVLTSSKGIEQTREGRTTTVQPDSDHDAYTVVTDFRVLFLVGSDAEEASVDIEFDMATITLSEARSSLFSSSLVVVSRQTNSVKFTPSGGPDLEEVADYIDRISDAWADLHRAIATTRDAIDEFEAALTAGDDAQEELTTAQSRLSNAYHHATRNDDGPAEAMLALIEPVEAELDRLQVEVRLDRVDDLLADAESHEDFGDAVASLVEARNRLREARDVLDDEVAEGDGTTETIDDRSTAIDEQAEWLLADAEARCHEALDADGPETAAASWESALERYRTLRDADWDGLGGVADDAVRYQVAWVVGRRIDALCELSRERETVADELEDSGDDATEVLEQAKSHIESAQALADEHPHADGDRFTDRLDDLSEKIEVSEWQWGNA